MLSYFKNFLCKPCYNIKLRQKLKGFFFLKKNRKLDLWRNIKFNFLNTSVSQIDGLTKANKFFFQSSHPSTKLIVQQYCADLVLKSWLGGQLLRYAGNSDKKLLWPLNKNWLRVLKQADIKYSHFINLILWGLLVLYIFLLNFYKTCILILVIRPRHLFESTVSFREDSAYFFGLNKKNILGLDNIECYDIISWYVRSNKINHKVKLIKHGVSELKDYTIGNIKVIYTPLPFEKSQDHKTFLKFIAWFFLATLLCLFDLFMLRWERPLLLLEAAKLRIFELSDPNLISRDYYFYWAGSSYRPMWTYYLKKLGSQVTLYFYSLSEQPQLSYKAPDMKADLWLLNWPYYFFWNDRHRAYHSESIGSEVNSSISGATWFSDSVEHFPNEIDEYISVFCVENFRKAYYVGSTSVMEYFEYNNNLSSKFLEDIADCCKIAKINMVHKRKRIQGKRVLKSYMSVINALSRSNYYHSINTEISPIKVIKGSIGVISFPYTSAAYIAKELNKPTVYYDPSNTLDVNNFASHNIVLIKGKNNLLEWIVGLKKA